MKKTSKELIAKIIVTIIIGGLSITMIIPFLWMISASFKINADVLKIPIKWIPNYFYIDNYKFVWHLGEASQIDYHFAIAYFNSIKITSINVVFSLLTSCLAGYAFAKINFRGAKVMFILYLATMMIPSQVTMIPKFVIFDKLGLMGTHWTLILPGIVTVTGTFLMRQSFIQISNELREAAQIDGASELRIFWQIILPLVKPAMASLAMIVFMWNWNNFMDPLVFLRDWRTYTIPVALTNFMDENITDYSLVMAASVSALMPVLIVFLLGQKYFVKGLTAGSVKG